MPTNTGTPTPRRQQPKRRRGCFSSLLVFSAAFLAVLLLGLVAVFGVLKGVLFREYTPAARVASDSVDESKLEDASYVKNILLIGQDTLTLEENSRSDAMLLVSLNTRSNTIKLVSFMRDIYIEIPGYVPSKLNASCAYGGPSLVAETLEYNFHIKIDGYARVGFTALADIVDAVGGVVIPEITPIETQAMLDGYGVTIGPGAGIRLNGEHAVQYCRIRQYQDDFSRTQRQRVVLTQLLKSVKLSNVDNLLGAAQTILANVDCSFSETQLFRLGLQALPCLTNDIEQMQIPPDGSWQDDMVDGQAVLEIDFNESRAALKDFLY